MTVDPAITRQLVSLVDRSDGVVEVVDPETDRVFVVVERAATTGYGAPPDQSMVGKTKAEIDAMIEAGIASGPATPMTDADWQAIRDSVAKVAETAAESDR